MVLISPINCICLKIWGNFSLSQYVLNLDASHFFTYINGISFSVDTILDILKIYFCVPFMQVLNLCSASNFLLIEISGIFCPFLLCWEYGKQCMPYICPFLNQIFHFRLLMENFRQNSKMKIVICFCLQSFKDCCFNAFSKN